MQTSQAQNTQSASLAGVIHSFQPGTVFSPKRPVRQASLLSQLISGESSLIQFDPVQIEHLHIALENPGQEKQIRKELMLTLHAALSGLKGIRQNGLPVLADQARFRYQLEADFALRRTSGDLNGGKPDLTDLHLLSVHVRDQLLSACSACGAIEMGRHARLAYFTAFELLS